MTPLERKNNIIHVRVTPSEKERLIECAKKITEDLPYMCLRCETRFTADKAYAYKYKCPFCNGEIKKAEARPSQIMRYGWKFLEGIQNYSFYDALLVMNNICLIRLLNIPLKSLDGDGIATLGEAINYVINENVDIKERLASIPFNTVLRIFYAKTHNKLKGRGEDFF